MPRTGRPVIIEQTPGTATGDLELAKRFHDFRTKHISKSMNEAAKLLGVSQGYISKIESGAKGIGYSMIENLITNYQLNAEWLTTGHGAMKQNVERPKKDLVKDVNSLLQEIELLKKTILIMQKNQEHFINRIAQKMELFERMERFMHEHK
jgi:transcriptional regulator with XRE-family HTH domain